MNAWGQISLAEVSTTGLFASDAALHDEEFLAGLADAAWYDRLSWREKLVSDATGAWNQYEARLVDLYADYMTIRRLPILCRAARAKTLGLCAGKLDRQKQAELKMLNEDIDTVRQKYRRQKADVLKAAIQAVERDVLARLGTTTAKWVRGEN